MQDEHLGTHCAEVTEVVPYKSRRNHLLPVFVITSGLDQSPGHQRVVAHHAMQLLCVVHHELLQFFLGLSTSAKFSVHGLILSSQGDLEEFMATQEHFRPFVYVAICDAMGLRTRQSYHWTLRDVRANGPVPILVMLEQTVVFLTLLILQQVAIDEIESTVCVAPESLHEALNRLSIALKHILIVNLDVLHDKTTPRLVRPLHGHTLLLFVHLCPVVGQTGESARLLVKSKPCGVCLLVYTAHYIWQVATYLELEWLSLSIGVHVSIEGDHE